jgi:hypothetical protein
VDIHVGNTIVNGDLTLSGDIKSNGNINIDINLSDSTLRRWQFGEDGALTFPDGTSQSTAYTGGSGTGDITFSTRTIAASTAGEIRVQSANGVSLGPLTTQSDIRLTFDGLGLTVGGSNTLQGLNYRLFTDAGTPKDQLFTYRTGNLSEFLIQAGGTVGGILKLSADGSNGFINLISNGTTWKFAPNGQLTFPDTTVQTTAYQVTKSITHTANLLAGTSSFGQGSSIAITDNYQTERVSITNSLGDVARATLANITSIGKIVILTSTSPHTTYVDRYGWSGATQSYVSVSDSGNGVVILMSLGSNGWKLIRSNE